MMATSMVTEDELVQEFEDFDIELTDPDVVDKLKELCVVYRLDCSSIVSEWVAYSISRNDQKMTVESLEEMEQDRISKKKKKIAKTPTVTSPALFSSDPIAEESDDLLSAYTPAGKSKHKRLHTTPENPPNKRLQGVHRHGNIPFSPASFSPPVVATPSQKYSSRSNQYEVVASYGPTSRTSWKGTNAQTCSVQYFDEDSALKKNYKYMFHKFTDKASVLNDMIESMAQQLQETHGIESFSHLALPIQESVTVVGRVCCDTSNGRLNAQSVLLEGSVETSSGKQVMLSLSNIKEFSLFPGQIITLDGINSTGVKLVASKIYESIALPLNQSEDTSLADYGPLHVMTAGGPYTTVDTLSYEPFDDLIRVMVQETPDVCILFGPFVDANHAKIKDYTQDPADLFKIQMMKLVEATKKIGTHLVIVPSLRDVHHDFIYPQPPFQIPDSLPDKDRLHFVSDPCTLSINGVVFGLTSSDILFHLGSEEISHPPGSSDRLGRLTKHILTQHNYYPLYPPPECMPIDYEHYEQFAHMEVTPDVFISPSDLRWFIKEACGCLTINPGRLTRGQVGGTYAKLVITPSENTKTVGVTALSAAQILRI
ncbi:DNA polymerase alpha subunit B-like [Acanthaster planci]|uniref:DNA polymerase alpha subunit B n=1 Tax=Acanthaster planci TaxID=133434 RepID=A0A8B7YNX7_ACAPL|nr:DNA polymerase alpha subunit B-like [Acanthaster planci]